MMKKILSAQAFVLIGFILALPPGHVFGQCPDIFPFNYTKCGATEGCTAAQKVECTAVPYAARTDGFHLERWPSGTTINYYFRTDEFNGELDPNPCWLDPATMSACFQNAIAAWTRVCKNSHPVQVNYDPTFSSPCVVSIGVSNPEDKESFPDPGDQSAVTHKTHDCSGNLICSNPGCPNGYIYVMFNQTTKWRELYQFVTQCPPPTTCGSLGKREPVNICSVMLHEAGHLFGLQDIKTNNCGFSDNKGMAMWGAFVDPKTTCEDLTITPRDICYFKMIYCPDEAGVSNESPQKFDETLGLSVYPNPTNSNLNVAYDISKGKAESLEVYSIEGTKLLFIDLAGKSPKSIVHIQTSGWPSGSYIVRLNTNNSFIQRLAHVVH